MSYFVLAAVWFISFHPFLLSSLGLNHFAYSFTKKNNNMKMTILTSLLLLITVVSCNTTDPTPPDETKPTLTLAIDDASCTEAWLQLTTKDLTLPAELTLIQYNPSGDSLSKILILNTQDSLLYVDSLLPNQIYNFQLSCIWNPTSGNEQQVLSIEQQVTTMDTTSHNFTFQSWTFGTIGSSVLYDVAIIDENNIWAVGEIMIADTSQNGYTTYNAVHWDGSEWELLRIPNYDYPNALVYGALQTIFAFSENDVWFCSYSNLVHYDGNNFTSKAQFMTSINFNGQVKKMWGTDSSNLYCVGRSGSIYHYNGANWQRIESGTDLEFLDIYGTTDPKTNQQQILAVCTRNYPLDKAIYIIEGNTATQISSTPIHWELFSCWFIPNKQYYVVGDGIYEKTNLSINSWIDNAFNITHYATTRVRGNNINDIFVVGAFGEILHYNGFRWKSFLPELGTFSGSYGSLDIKESLVAITGFESAKAKITLGNR